MVLGMCFGAFVNAARVDWLNNVNVTGIVRVRSHWIMIRGSKTLLTCVHLYNINKLLLQVY